MSVYLKSFWPITPSGRVCLKGGKVGKRLCVSQMIAESRPGRSTLKVWP